MSAQRNPSVAPTKKELLHFFLSHLNRIFCAKSELLVKLPILQKRARFLDLQQAITETIEVVSLQIGRMKRIYILLDDFYRPESCVGLLGMLDEAFQTVGAPNESPAISDLSLLFYMQNIESIEAASFQMMMQVADHLECPEVVQLLRECLDEARDDNGLLKAITENYL
jgi:ferritin-like metal-binding protein YciE